MSEFEPSYSKTGVRIAADFRSNLIVDRYDPLLAAMRGSKREHLRSENSEDALTWNVFRSLLQVSPTRWLTPFLWRALGETAPTITDETAVRLWVEVAPPPSIREHQKDEGASEIDILVETAEAVVFIEAKYRSDVSLRTTNNPTRDQVLRNLDVGSYLAAPRDFYFVLLVLDESRTAEGMRLLREYRSNRGQLLERLPHRRPEELSNLKGLGHARWADLARIAADLAGSGNVDTVQQAQLRALTAWLADRGIHPAPAT